MREEQVNNAVQFLRDPEVASSSLAKRVEFLESKELTKDEIEEALKRANNSDHHQPSTGTTSSYSSTAQSYVNRPPPLPERDWRDYFVMATVTAGVGYGLYEVAKRYVVPLIMPPTPASLEADKSALEAEFDRVSSMLEQLKTDTEEIKQREQERSEKFDALMTDVQNAVESVKAQTQQRESDMKLIKSQVENVRESLPKSLEKHRQQQDAALIQVQDELKSLKQLISNRMKVGGSNSGPPPVSAVPSFPVPGQQAVSSQGFVPVPAGATTTSANANSPSTTTTTTTNPSTPRAGIPAWQLAAANASSSASSTPPPKEEQRA